MIKFKILIKKIIKMNNKPKDKKDTPNISDIEIEKKLVLKDDEKLILEELSKIDKLDESINFLAESFLSAITIYKNNYPDKYAIIAHCFREIIEKLPRVLDVPEVDFHLSSEIRNLESKWKNTKKNNIKFTLMTPYLSSFLQNLDNFFNRFNRSIPTKKEQAVKLIRNLDPSEISLPSKIETLHADEWINYYRYFTKVAHHNCIPEEHEFSQWSNAFKKCLSDKLRRRTFVNIDKIEKIIIEGESSD